MIGRNDLISNYLKRQLIILEKSFILSVSFKNLLLYFLSLNLFFLIFYSE
jgi:hypothetical protein